MFWCSTHPGTRAWCSPRLCNGINCDAQKSGPAGTSADVAGRAHRLCHEPSSALSWQQTGAADYLPAAVTKRAGEDALRAMRPAFGAKGISLVVLSGDMIDGTITVRLMEPRDPDAWAARRAAAPGASCTLVPDSLLSVVAIFCAALRQPPCTPPRGWKTVAGRSWSKSDSLGSLEQNLAILDSGMT